jgi:type IV pilus assembly protein PilO
MKTVRRNPFSLLNLHLLVLGLLVIFNLVLVGRLVLAWRTLHAAGPEQIQQEQSSYLALNLETRPLRGLPKKVEQARTQADRFCAQRIPNADSAVLSVIGDLADKNNVRLTHNAYVQAPASRGLTEMRMDASLSGEYAPIMHFINSLERSKPFFVIDGLTLTGQQGGAVNLRLRLTTYLQTASPETAASPGQRDEAQTREGEGTR